MEGERVRFRYNLRYQIVGTNTKNPHGNSGHNIVEMMFY